MLEKTLESLLDCKEIQPVHPKVNQPWLLTGRIDAKAETPILWPPDAKNWIIWKDLDSGKDWRQEEKGMTEDEMVGWHHQLNRYEFGWTPGAGDGQGGLACYSPWGWQRVGQDRSTELNFPLYVCLYPILHIHWCEELIHWKRLWCWERLEAGGDGYDRGWDGWMASLIQWTWIWANSGRWWRKGKPGMLQLWGHIELDTI